MRRFVRSTPSAAALAGTILVLLSGCSACHKVEFDDACRVSAERLEIHYVLDGYRGGYWSRALTLSPPPDEGSPVNELPETDKGTTCQRAELHVVWPHSECAPDKARAIIRLWHRGRPEPVRKPKLGLGRPYGKFVSFFDRRMILPDEMEERNELFNDAATTEIYTLDFARSELDLILPDLVCAGYFGPQWRPNGGAQLIVQVDRKRFQKIWTPEPRLDDLLTRVSEDGRRFLPVPPTPADDAAAHPGDGAKDDAKPGRSKFDADPDLPLPPLPDEGDKSDAGKRRSKSTPKAVKSDPEARPIPLPPEPSPEPLPPEPLAPPFDDAPFDDTPADDVLPPPLQPELNARPKEAPPIPRFDEEP